jgi:hypothetical protein
MGMSARLNAEQGSFGCAQTLVPSVLSWLLPAQYGTKAVSSKFATILMDPLGNCPHVGMHVCVDVTMAAGCRLLDQCSGRIASNI